MHTSSGVQSPSLPRMSALSLLLLLPRVLKLRIGVSIAFAALAGAAIVPGPALPGWQLAVLALAVLLSSASAGGFNQYFERDLDRHMSRTRGRPFATGTLSPGRGWLWFFSALLLAPVAVTAWLLNPFAALYVFLGGFFYTVVYTVWLKRRSWLNIVIGGLSGSFAVLAGAAAVDPAIGARAGLLTLVLFLWTPSHFWSLAIALHKDYARAGVPMLPVVVGDRAAARAVLANTVLLVTASLVPVFYGMGPVYLLGAVGGGAWFLYRNVRMWRQPNPATAMSCFYASLVQLSILLTAVIIDVRLNF